MFRRFWSKLSFVFGQEVLGSVNALFAGILSLDQRGEVDSKDQLICGSWKCGEQPEGSDPEAIVNGGDGDEGGNDWRERKRRKDRYTTERQSVIKGRRDAEETAIVHNRQFRGRGR